MICRRATMEDAEGVANVLMQSYNIEDIEEGKQVFESEMHKECHYIVAEDEGKIVGIASWMMHALPKHELAELDRIAVLPECRGKGVAKQVFEKLKEDADEFYKSKGFRLRKLYLLTHEGNDRAQAFYTKIGFKKEVVLKNHLYDGVDEAVFSIFFRKEGKSESPE